MPDFGGKKTGFESRQRWRTKNKFRAAELLRRGGRSASRKVEKSRSEGMWRKWETIRRQPVGFRLPQEAFFLPSKQEEAVSKQEEGSNREGGDGRSPLRKGNIDLQRLSETTKCIISLAFIPHTTLRTPENSAHELL